MRQLRHDRGVYDAEDELLLVVLRLAIDQEAAWRRSQEVVPDWQRPTTAAERCREFLQLVLLVVVDSLGPLTQGATFRPEWAPIPALVDEASAQQRLRLSVREPEQLEAHLACVPDVVVEHLLATGGEGREAGRGQEHHSWRQPHLTGCETELRGGQRPPTQIANVLCDLHRVRRRIFELDIETNTCVSLLRIPGEYDLFRRDAADRYAACERFNVHRVVVVERDVVRIHFGLSVIRIGPLQERRCDRPEGGHLLDAGCAPRRTEQSVSSHDFITCRQRQRVRRSHGQRRRILVPGER